MIVKDIEYSPRFLKRFYKLPKNIAAMAVKKEELFKANPLHPSLRLHSLRGKFRGYWSISVNQNYRIIFRRTSSGNVLFVSIGKHDIYRYL